MKLCFVVIVFGLSFIICNKHYIKYSACYKLPIPKTPFYPDAYKFANTKEEFLSNMKLINNAIKVEAIIDTNKLDFNNHTYLFVFGAPIKKMYYSFKTTLFDDKSPSYAKAIRHKKICGLFFCRAECDDGYPSGPFQRHVHRRCPDVPQYGKDPGPYHQFYCFTFQSVTATSRRIDAGYQSACKRCRNASGRGGSCKGGPDR